MGLNVTFVSGPRGAGKSALIRTMIDRLWKKPPHYFRLVTVDSDKQPPPPSPSRKIPETGVASARWIRVDSEHVFEQLPEALTSVHREDRFGSVVVEADADPLLRNAYPYDNRIFVMPIPETIQDVFRNPTRAAEELRRALDDTAAFASEIFGLVPQLDQFDTEPSEERADLSDTQMRGFLYSPLGDELATRIILQPTYHGLVESDVIIVNAGVGQHAEETDACLTRVTRLLDRLRGATGKKSSLHFCDPRDFESPDCKELCAMLAPMCLAGK